tara:strand:+ start:1387 stop:1593 length:207 start_codon:yes stop_codon:yes gene_type:complete
MQILMGILVCSALLVMLQGSWLMVMDAEERHKKRQEEKHIEADDEPDNHWARLRKAYPAIEKEDIHNG